MPRFALICESPREYIASVIDRRELENRYGSEFHPITAEAAKGGLRIARGSEPTMRPYVSTSTLRRGRNIKLHNLLDVCVELTQAEVGADAPHCVVAQGDSGAYIGAAYAVVSGRRLVVVGHDEDIGRLLRREGDPGSVLLVASLGWFRSRGLTQLERQVGDALRDRSAPWGLLTASSCSGLEQLALRNRVRTPPKRRRGKLYRTGAPTGLICEDPELEHISLRKNPDPALADLTRRGVPFVHFVGHSRSYCAANGNLCSLFGPSEAGDSRCVGDYTCMFPTWPRIPARRLRVELAILETCSSASLVGHGPLEGTGLNLAIQFLDGYASALIAPPRTSWSVPIGCYLAWDILTRGCSAGEVCVALNELARDRFGALPPLLLLGDPELRLFEGVERPQSAARVSSEDEGVWSVDLPFSGGVRSFRCDHPGLVAAGSAGPLHCLPAETGGSEVWVQPSPLQRCEETLDLLAVGARQPSGPTLRLDLTDRPPFRPEVERYARDLSENLLSEEHWMTARYGSTADAASPDAIETLRSELRNLEAPVLDARDLSVGSGSHYLALYAAEQRLLEVCRLVGRQQIEAMLQVARERGLWLFREYALGPGMRALSEVRLTQPCPRCGQVQYLRRYQAGLWPGQIRRMWECERCMLLADVGKCLDEVRLIGMERVSLESPAFVAIEVRNPASFPVYVHGAVSVERLGMPESSIQVRPRLCEQFLEPGHRLHLEFELRFDPTISAHLYHVMGLMVAAGSPSWALLPLEVLQERA